MPEIPDLWPSGTAVQADDMPVAILRRQAEYLNDRYAGRLMGEVEARPLGQQMWLTFYIAAPALNHYRYRLFDVRYGLDGYPATVSFYDDEFPIHGCAAFQDWLRGIFNDIRTQRVIAQLNDAVEAQMHTSEAA